MISELARAALGARSSVATLAASGRPVIGILGRDVPVLLVASAGAHPFRIAPDEISTDEADVILGRAVDRAVARVLAAVLTGSLDFLSGILISRDSEASVRLFYTLQELHRRGRTAVPVQLVDQVHQDRESTVRYNVGQLQKMWRVVEDWSSAEITAESLGTALSGLTEVRTELERVRRERRAARVRGVESLYGYRVATALPPTDAVRLLRAEDAKPTDSAFPLFLTGSAPLGDEIYRAIEDAGATVVGEDHDWGDPILSDRLPERIGSDTGALLRELALSRLRGAPASASSTMAARADATLAGIQATHARGLLSVVRTHDEAPAWDWRLQRERAGVPGAMVRGDAAIDPEQIGAAVIALRAAS